MEREPKDALERALKAAIDRKGANHSEPDFKDDRKVNAPVRLSAKDIMRLRHHAIRNGQKPSSFMRDLVIKALDTLDTEEFQSAVKTDANAKDPVNRLYDQIERMVSERLTKNVQTMIDEVSRFNTLVEEMNRIDSLRVDKLSHLRSNLVRQLNRGDTFHK